MQQRRPGRQLHDPAWNGQDFSRRHHASGDRPTCVAGDHRRRQGCCEPGAGLSKPHGCETKRPVRSHRSTLWRQSHHPEHQPKSKISIASACGPRVPSSGTFVRLPAPETLHDSGLSALRFPAGKADNRVRSRYDLTRLMGVALPRLSIGRGLQRQHIKPPR
jgi:hypothetical protein